MLKPDIHQLEERVLALIGEFRRLKEENRGLSLQVEQLTREKEVLEQETILNRSKLSRLPKLESQSRKNEIDQNVIRAKVQELIKNLDKFDLA